MRFETPSMTVASTESQSTPENPFVITGWSQQEVVDLDYALNHVGPALETVKEYMMEHRGLSEALRSIVNDDQYTTTRKKADEIERVINEFTNKGIDSKDSIAA